jgi:ABC-type bacteriocin/lantibiotic exporter with double-glycine peptidase domain
MALLVVAVALIFVGSQGRTLLTALGNFLILSAAERLSLSLRVNLLRHLDTLSAEYYETAPVGSVMYPLKEPIDEVANFGSDLVPAILRLALTTGFTFATMFWLSQGLTLTVLPLIPAFLVARAHFRHRLATDSDSVQENHLNWNTFLEEHLSSLIPIQLLGQQRRQERKAFRLLVRALRSQQKLFTTGIWFTLSSFLAVALSLCAVIAYGGTSVVAGKLSVGSLVAFYGFVTQLFEPLSGAAELYARTKKTFASVRQIQSAFGLQARVTEASMALPIVWHRPPTVEFAAVEFSYARQTNLLHIPRLRILPGEHIGIAGENGAGKSTLAKLMVRLYDPIRGSIRLGGEDLKNFQLKSLRRQICYLGREPVLFDGTLESNLRIAHPTATENKLQEVIQLVGLSSLVASLPGGLRQRVGPGGCQLSGGQRQRLAIARALLERPQVLILDEATSGLDPSGEALVLTNLRQHFHLSTIIVVSHRLSTLSRFERVIFLAAGRIVSDGDPTSVIDAKPSSRGLTIQAESQLRR